MQRTCPTAVDFDACANLPIRTALSPQYHFLRTLPAAAAQRLDGRGTGNRAGGLEGESPAHRSRALESESCQIERAKTVRGRERRGMGRGGSGNQHPRNGAVVHAAGRDGGRTSAGEQPGSDLGFVHEFRPMCSRSLKSGLLSAFPPCLSRSRT